jgi:tartrate-resistant acid phosphatase type 5
LHPLTSVATGFPRLAVVSFRKRYGTDLSSEQNRSENIVKRLLLFISTLTALVIIVALVGPTQNSPSSYAGEPHAAAGQLGITPTVAMYLPLIQYSVTPTPASARVAVIGDYGLASQGEQDVATLVKSWAPDLIITTGDNNYPEGAASTIDQNIGQYYHDFIFPYTGIYGAGANANRFFPSLGNHDWIASGAIPYFDYFTLPGNERYYDAGEGPVQLFALDSDPHEPDGVSSTSQQATWLQSRLATSSACWKLVYFHHAPYSSGPHGPSTWMQWPFATWGADAVLSGHDHTYERILINGFPYFVDGLGDSSQYAFEAPIAGSQARYNAGPGAMRVTATWTTITYEFIAADGKMIDTYTQNKECAGTSTLFRITP